MAPNAVENENHLVEDEKLFPRLKAPQADPSWKFEISYFNIVAFSYWHAAGLYGGYLVLTSAKWATFAFAIGNYYLGLLGIVAGAHRLWAHKSFKAKMPLQMILMVLFSICGHYSVFDWVRNHRLHHKYSDTDADPHNASRGFFFSHIGWLFVVKHPEVKKRGAFTDMSDLTSNPVLAFQRKYAGIWLALMCYIIPTLIPMYCWNETLSNAWHVNLFRFIVTLHNIGLINSAAHMFGYKPYDQHISPVENKLVSIALIGEAFHNYHHVFPWDYKVSEFGKEWFHLGTKFIEFFAWVGWAYDLKTADPALVAKRKQRTGDGTHAQ